MISAGEPYLHDVIIADRAASKEAQSQLQT